MKCLNCGCASDHYLCSACTTADILDRIFNEICQYKPETCENPYLAEIASGFTEKYAERDLIPVILEQFDSEVSEYYYCLYYLMCKDPRCEEAAEAYLRTHALGEIRTQLVLHRLLERYIRSDLDKPRRWCQIISTTGDLCCDLYVKAAEYLSMVGEYDAADAVADQGIELHGDISRRKLLSSSPEYVRSELDKQKKNISRYRGGKPYWPTSEDRRRAVAKIYDAKGIKHPRVEKLTQKIPENEFAPLRECYDDGLTDYCAFWCSEVFSVSAAKGIYQIAAAKVSGGTVTDTFEAFVHPRDGGVKAKKAAAKEAGVDLEVIEAADDVDLVMPRFFAFVGDDVLVSTGALGQQAKLISRAARYAGMREIRNAFYDLLDLADDTSDDFAGYDRKQLLSHFGIAEGKSALEKARINKQLFDALMRCGG